MALGVTQVWGEMGWMQSLAGRWCVWLCLLKRSNAVYNVNVPNVGPCKHAGQ